MAESPAPVSLRGAERGRRFGRVLAPTVYKVAVRGREHVPSSGPLVVVSNHTGFLDGPMIFCLFPRPVHFLVKRSYFDSPFGPVLRGVGQIPIQQNTGDREALTSARRVLTDGGVVGIFPEGTRGRGLVEQAQQGAAFLALGTGAQVLPAACFGTRPTGRGRDSWPRPRSRLDLVLGEPFSVTDDEGGPGREKLRRATERVRVELGEHVRAAAQASLLALPEDVPPPVR